MPIDDHLSAPDWSERHEREVAAPPADALAAAHTVTLRDMPLAAVLMGMRGLRPRRPPREPFIELVETRVGLARLEDGVWGGALRPWHVRGASRPVDDLLAFTEPGWVRIAVSLEAEPRGAGSLLATETRIAATSEDARRAFGRYWLLVRHGSGLVRRSWLAAAERRALARGRPEGLRSDVR